LLRYFRTMSLIGRKPILIPEKVDVEIQNEAVSVKGPMGELKKTLPTFITLKKSDSRLMVDVKNTQKASLVGRGTYRSLIASMVLGVSSGFTKTLELVGTGYRAEVNGDELVLSVGHSHPVKFKAPSGISFKVEKNDITITGIDKHEVGLLASKIKMSRPPDPYKGKGVKYKSEVLRKKPGKAAKTAGAA